MDIPNNNPQNITDQTCGKVKQWGDKDSAELGALVAQYESLRKESLNSINNRVQILLLGLAAIGAITGGTLTIEHPAEKKILIYTIFSGVIPLIYIFVLFTWMSEAMRAHRAGNFLAANVETQINKKFGRSLLTWETSLWLGTHPRDEWFGPSMMSLATLSVIIGVAPLFGLLFSCTPIVPLATPLLVLGVPYIFLLLALFYTVRNMTRLRSSSHNLLSIRQNEL